MSQFIHNSLMDITMLKKALFTSADIEAAIKTFINDGPKEIIKKTKRNKQSSIKVRKKALNKKGN